VPTGGFTFRFQGGDAYDVDLEDYHYDSMPMKNPVHPGALAKANLEELNLSVAGAAKTMKISRQQLYNVMRGRSAVTPVMAWRFERAFGGVADMWLRMQAAYDLAEALKGQGEIDIPRLVEHRTS